MPQYEMKAMTHRSVYWPRLIGMALLGCFLAVSVEAQTSRIKRISLMTPDLDQSIAFFTGVIGFTLDFEGTLPPGGEPFLGPVFTSTPPNLFVGRCCRPQLKRAGCS